MQTAVGLRHLRRREVTAAPWANGTLAEPGGFFINDPNNGVHLLGADYWELVAGGTTAMRLALDEYGTRADFGNSVFDLQGFAIGNVVSINHTTAEDNDGTIGLTTSIINNGAVGADGLTGQPDSAALNASIFQTDAAAKGAMRAIESHTVRVESDPNASTLMGMEMGVHTGLAGNANFPFTQINPFSMGIWLSSYQDSNMAGWPGGAVAAVPVDVGLFITGHPGGGGAGGFRYPIATTDASNVLRFALASTGVVYLSTGGNAAAPQVTFIGDTNTGFFWGGADVLAGSAGGVEHFRCTNLAFQVSTGLILNGVISPAQLTANTDNWNPTDLATASVIRVSTDATRNLTGLSALSRRVMSLQNVGAFNLILKHDVTSTAANRFSLPASQDIVLTPGSSVTLWYDDTSTRWRCLDVQLGGPTVMGGVISPAQLTANTNNWAPTGLSTATHIRVSTDAPRDLTGIDATGMTGRFLALHQIGGSTLVLKNNSGSSSAANVIHTPGGVDYTLGANESVWLWYDATTPCWRVFGTN